MKTSQYRDLTILEVNPATQLAIACDSSASIGAKKNDMIQLDPKVMAACCLRVPLFELMCIGAKPISIVDMIGNEYEPTGKRMLEGIKSEMTKAGIEEVILNGSTEENMTTSMSTIGITVIGTLDDGLKKETIISGDYLCQLGRPLMGQEVVENLEKLCNYQQLKELKEGSAIKDLLPVGSKGIGYEANILATENLLEINFKNMTKEQLIKSAGPATVVLAVVEKEMLDAVLEKYPYLLEIGQFN